MESASSSVDDRRDGRFTAEVEALLSSPSAPSSEAFLGYDPSGNKIETKDRRDVVTLMTYDNVSRPRRTTLVPHLTGVGHATDVQYDDLGRTRTEIDARGTRTVISLDKLGREIRVEEFETGVVNELRDHGSARVVCKLFDDEVRRAKKRLGADAADRCCGDLPSGARDGVRDGEGGAESRAVQGLNGRTCDVVDSANRWNRLDE